MKKLFIFALCISFLASIIVACKSQPNPNPINPTKEKIRLVEVTHSVFYAPQYVAISKGFFAEQGLDIQLVNGNGGDKTMTTLLAKQADIALVGIETGLYVNIRNSSQPIVAFAQLTQNDGSFLLARQPLANFEWCLLKKKTLLGQRRGGMPQMVSEHILKNNKIAPHKDVKIIQNVDFKNIAHAFTSGTGDFVQLFEPVASMLEQENKGYIVASLGKESGTLPYTSYLTRKDFLKQNPALIKKFTKALIKAQQWVKEHTPEEIATAIASHFRETDRTILIKAITRYKEQQSFAVDPIIDRTEFNHFINIVKEAGELKKNVTYEQLIDTSISEAAMKELIVK